MAAAFQLCFIAFPVNVIDRRDPSNEIRCQLKPKKAKIRPHSHLYNSKRCFNHPSLLTRRSASVLKWVCHTCGKWQNASPDKAKEG